MSSATPVPGRVRDRDVAGAVGVEEAGRAEHRLAPEDQRVEEVVVDPAVDHVHALQPARRAHEDDVLVADEVAPLHQLDPHLAREERVLVVGGVVHAGREQDDGEVAARRGGSDRVQDGEQLLRVVVDPGDAVPLEELRERALHRGPVLEHVARPRGRAQVVLEHEVLALVVADHVDARHVRVDAAGRLDADHLAHEVARPEEQLARDLPVADDPLLAVDVVEEEVERAHPLDDAAREPVPLRARDHARDQVEREDPLDPLLLAVDREADPLVHERQLDRVPPLLELLEAEPAELLRERPVVRPRRSGRLEHLVVERARVVRLPEGPRRRQAHEPPSRRAAASTYESGKLPADVQPPST